MFGGIAHLFGRHPALNTYQPFRSWLAKHGAHNWYEEHVDGVTQVFIVSRDETSLHAIDINTSGETLTNIVTRGPSPVAGSRTHDISQLPALGEAIKDTRRRGATLEAIVGAHYRIDGDNVDLQVEVLDHDQVISYSQTNPAIQKQARAFKLAPKPAKPPKPDENDWLAANDLHTPAAFRKEADEWTAGLSSVRDKAAAICAGVKSTYKWDGLIAHIKSFTWRDTLTRDRNGKRGVCDEFAVVTISCLRSIGIPARMKYIKWLGAEGEVHHAFVEFLDAGAWVHLDSTWGVFDNPARYRESGRDIYVRDADNPDDSRSTSEVNGYFDHRTDGMLHSYADFILSDWSKRPGYSY